MLQRLGKSLSEGDPIGAARCWDAPGLALGEGGTIAISSLAEVENFFAGAIDAYRARGVFTTRPEVERFEMFSETLAAVDVRWPGFDEAGNEVKDVSERSHYIVQSGEDGEVYVRVALGRTS